MTSPSEIVNLQTYKLVAKHLLERNKLSIPIHAYRDNTCDEIAKKVEAILNRESKKDGSSPMTVSFDGSEPYVDNMVLARFSLHNSTNKARAHHVVLTRFKEEDL